MVRDHLDTIVLWSGTQYYMAYIPASHMTLLVLSWKLFFFFFFSLSLVVFIPSQIENTAMKHIE